jgi:predicted enzyme related to lactoylglutathione lyase
MCILSDLGGAICALWHPKQHIGATVMNQHGALTWAELWSRDVDAAGGFYTKLHGYGVDAMPMPNGITYTVFQVGDKPACGMMAMPQEVPAQVHPHWTPYFDVQDCDAAIKAAQAGGGKALTAALEVAGVGRFATLADPQGATFAVLQSAGA